MTKKQTGIIALVVLVGIKGKLGVQMGVQMGVRNQF